MRHPLVFVTAFCAVLVGSPVLGIATIDGTGGVCVGPESGQDTSVTPFMPANHLDERMPINDDQGIMDIVPEGEFKIESLQITYVDVAAQVLTAVAESGEAFLFLVTDPIGHLHVGDRVEVILDEQSESAVILGVLPLGKRDPVVPHGVI